MKNSRIRGFTKSRLSGEVDAESTALTCIALHVSERTLGSSHLTTDIDYPSASRVDIDVRCPNSMSLVRICQSLKLLSLSSCKSTNLAFISTTNCLAAAPKATGGALLGRKRFRRPPKSSDPEYLVSHVAGSNYLKEGEDVKIKDDSEYPDWIWNLNLGRPKKPDELEFGTKEYWESLKFINFVKRKRIQGYLPKRKMTLGEPELRELRFKQRIRFRALAADDVEPGLDPEDYKARPDKKMILRPNRAISKEELYPDEFLSKYPEKFIKGSRAHDYVEQLAPRTRTSSRGKSGFFPSPSAVFIHPESFLAKLPDGEDLVSRSLKKSPVVPELPDADNSKTSN